MSDSSSPRTLRDGRYVIIGTLGAGAQGATLDAVDKRDGRPVAIKEFRVRGASSWKDVELAERETRVLSTLSHPSLPTYFEHFEENGALYLVMERIEGESLAQLRKRGALAASDVVSFLEQAAQTLEYLHSRSPPIVHRDIKPSNVIRRPDGTFAFVDFGSVRDHLKPEGGSTVVGTFGYMAPEQFQGRAGPGSDVYAVGATALCILTGQEPENLPHRGLAIDVPKALGQSADSALVHVLSRMVEPDPERRPERIMPLLDELQTSRRAGTRRARSRPGQHRVHDRGRDEWRKARAASPAPPFNPVVLAPFLFALFMLGLLIARVSTWALFRVFLPTLLGTLSVFFGSGLMRAARRCHEIGVAGERGLIAATHTVQARYRGATGKRFRVEWDSAERPVYDTTAIPQDEAEMADEATNDNEMRRRARH